MEETPAPQVQATAYEVSIFPEGTRERRHFKVCVEWRGGDAWAVTDGAYCLNSEGEWEVEPLPSHRTPEWKAYHRFPLEDALQRAREASLMLEVSGRTALEVWRVWREMQV